MIDHAKLGLLVAGLFLISTAASAQQRTAPARPAWHIAPVGRSSPVTRGAIAARPIIVHLPANSRTQGVGTRVSESVSGRDASSLSDANGFISSGASTFDIGQLLGNNVPGLGFDYSHLAALNQNLGERAFTDPATQEQLALEERLLQSTPAFGGVIPFLGGGYAEPAVEPEPPQPTVIVLQQPAAPAEAASAPSAARPAEGQAPLPDVGEFVLVLHNGNQIKAVAFTRQQDQIIYITKDGVRDAFPAADLDTARTKRLNQQHGTPLQLSL